MFVEEDELIKYECWDCDGKFLLSEIAEKAHLRVPTNRKIGCPFCESKAVFPVVKGKINDLGCLSLGKHHTVYIK